jgi:hypothetical protein
MNQAVKLSPEVVSQYPRGKAARQVETTLGELIAAAFDAVGDEAKDVVELLSSPLIQRSMRRRIVLV